MRPLEEEANELLERLRDGLAQVIAAQQGGEVRKAADLHKALGLDRPLAWSLYRVATSQHPLDAGLYVPGTGPMSRFLQAAEQRGVPSSLIEEVRTAFQRFEAFVERQAGDREAFESMISHQDRSRREAADLKHKRAAFRAAGHLWGLQSRTLTMCYILQPSPQQPEMVDRAMIHGNIGVRQMRPDIPTQSSIRWKVSDPEKGLTDIQSEEPIDPADTCMGGLNIFSKFCSQPVPTFRTRIDSNGFARAELISRGVGNNAAITYFGGSVSRCKPPPFSKPGKVRHYWYRVMRPTEVFLWDILVHRDLWQGPPPELRVCSGDGGGPESPEEWDAEKLPVQESIVELGMGTQALQTPHAPRYREMINYAIECLGWDPTKFRAFRCSIDYPIMHSYIRLSFPV